MKTYKYKIIPGKFDYREAEEILELLNISGYKIPNMKEAVKVINENDYVLGFKTLITSEAREFGEDGNWIYVAKKDTNLNDYQHYPVRNKHCDLVLIKEI